MKTRSVRKAGKKWYEKYLPFIARSPEMQVEWLTSALRQSSESAKNGTNVALTQAEISPYIRLLLTDDSEDTRELLVRLFREMDTAGITLMLEAADIYDTILLIGLIPSPTVAQAMIALGKTPPPYEKSPMITQDRVFKALKGHSTKLIEQAAAALRSSGRAPEHFEEAYLRFQEILKDEELLSAMYPQAKV